MNKKILAIFASYDSKNTVPQYVVTYLNELNKVADIIFVADNTLNNDEQKKISPYIIHCIAQKHGEYDFGSYKRGYSYALEHNLLSKYDDLILCNDSVFGPFYPLNEIIDKMNAQNFDFWGMFKHLASGRVEEHVQSYFIYLKNKAAHSEELKNFLLNVKKEKNKHDIIKKYEMGLSQTLLEAGFRCGGLFQDKKNAPHGKQAMEMIILGFPFLKKSLFNRKYFYERTYCRKIYKYKEVIKSINHCFDIKQIENYLIEYYGKFEYYFYLNGLRFYFLFNWKRFLFQKKVTNKGKMIIKICKTPVYSKKKEEVK